MFPMSQTAVYHLHRIARTLSSETKQRFRLSNQSDVEELLRLASASRDRQIRESLISFMRNCDSTEHQELHFLRSA